MRVRPKGRERGVRIESTSSEPGQMTSPEGRSLTCRMNSGLMRLLRLPLLTFVPSYDTPCRRNVLLQERSPARGTFGLN